LDWLSTLLNMMPITGQLELRCRYAGPWRVAEGPSSRGEMPYHVVVDGSAVLDDQDGGPPHDRVLLNYLPARLFVRTLRSGTDVAQAVTGAQLTDLVALMRNESGKDVLGGRAMLNALSAALFTLTLRFASESDEPPAGLLALAGNPRLAPALTALFHEPAHPWTLPELARRCNMSRATLARHFQDKLNRSASELLTDIRMTEAANQLKKSSMSVGAIAEAVGYQSEAAFQRAFKHHMGVTPAHWRRAA
jgi:AraC family transcriptional regulator, activator of mtrCDE